MSAKPTPSLAQTVNNVPALNGIRWVTEAFSLFRQQPVAWIVVSFVQFIIIMLLSVVPLLAAFTYMIFMLFAGSFALMADKTARKEAIVLSDLFICFRSRLLFSSLLGASFGVFVILLPFVLWLADMQGSMPSPAEVQAFQELTYAGMTDAEKQKQAVAFFSAHADGFLVMISILLLMGWLIAVFAAFAAPQIVFERVSPGRAILRSFMAILFNPLPVIVCTLNMAVLLALSFFPLMGLGLILLLPVSNILGYCMWKDVLTPSGR